MKKRRVVKKHSRRPSGKGKASKVRKLMRIANKACRKSATRAARGRTRFKRSTKRSRR